MVVEEPSVVAAVSNSAKLVSASGGFAASADPGHMIAQIQVTGVPDMQQASDAIAGGVSTTGVCQQPKPRSRESWRWSADIEVRRFDEEPDWLVLHLIVDC